MSPDERRALRAELREHHQGMRAKQGPEWDRPERDMKRDKWRDERRAAHAPEPVTPPAR